MRRIDLTVDDDEESPQHASAPPYVEAHRNPAYVEAQRNPAYVEAQRNPAYVEAQRNPAYVEAQRNPANVEARRNPANVEARVNPAIGKPWSTGLFDCHENETNAVMTAFFPCVTFGQIAEVLDEGEMTCSLGSLIYALMMPALCSQWIMGSKYRTKLRNNYGLVEAPYEDVISHLFCPCCSLCQEFRELQKRELDPALGWNGILAQRHARGSQDQVRVPPTAQTMNM